MLENAQYRHRDRPDQGLSRAEYLRARGFEREAADLEAGNTAMRGGAGVGETARPGGVEGRVPIDWTKPPELPIGMKAQTLREIQSDPTREQLFNTLLRFLDKESGGKFTGLYEKALRQEVLSAQDEALIAYARNELALRMPDAQKMRGSVNSQDIEGKK